MTEEVSELNNYQVRIFPAPIERVEITNMDALMETLNNLMFKYQNLVVAPDTKKDTKKIIAQLRKLKTEINTKKISVKKQLEKPIKAYEDQAKELMGVIDNTIEPLSQKVSEIEQQEKDERHEASMNLIKEMAPKYGLLPDEIEFDPAWDNQITTSKRTKLIGDHMGFLQMKKEQIKTAKQAVKAYAVSKGLDPESWELLVDNGQDFDTIQKNIDNVIEARKQEAERQKKQEESEKAIADMKREQQLKTVKTETGSVQVDVETGQIVASKDDMKKDPTFTQAFKVTGTKDQLWALSNEMDRIGVKYEAIKVEA